MATPLGNLATNKSLDTVTPDKCSSEFTGARGGGGWTGIKLFIQGRTLRVNEVWCIFIHICTWIFCLTVIPYTAAAIEIGGYEATYSLIFYQNSPYQTPLQNISIT